VSLFAKWMEEMNILRSERQLDVAPWTVAALVWHMYARVL
jgi:hypothetical protein